MALGAHMRPYSYMYCAPHWDGVLQIVQAEFLGLFSDNPDKILGMNIANFGTGSRQFQNGLRFGFDPGTNVFGFCDEFWYHSNSVTNREGTKRCPVYMGPRFRPFCVLLLEN